jgi:hypothetical protein
MSKARWAGLAAMLAMLAAGGWYVASPGYTLKQMKAAAQANDADRLSSYIDYPALREDMKSELTARMMAEAQKDNSGFGPLAVALGSAMVGPLVDAMISPAGVRAMMLSNRKNRKAPAAVGEDPVIERHGLSEFVVKSKSAENGAMVFKRHGLGWKLSGIDLPPPPLTNP